MTENLLNLSGRFLGRGTNHEGQAYNGTFEATPLKGGLSFKSEATGDNGTVFHKESSLIGKNMKGELCLFVLSNNHPGIFERQLKTQDVTADSATYVFAFGEPSDRGSFREEILIRVTANSVQHVYSWGLPGGDFAERSGCVMTRT